MTLEEQVGAMLVDGQAADLIQNQEPGTEVFAEFTFEAAAFLGGAQLVDDVDGVGVLFQELQAKEVLHLEPIDFLEPIPLELFEGLDDRKARGLHVQGHGALPALLVLAVDEPGQVFGVSPGLPGSLLGQVVVLRLQERQFEVVELLSQEGGVHSWGDCGLGS